ncbi:unnamed protein product [Linum trigynum]|uniref:Uncharacterized protein n=1 Tax=Linum trigynum TaxID=586398 RepID=A0AAV2FLJ7_9ROSI
MGLVSSSHSAPSSKVSDASTNHHHLHVHGDHDQDQKSLPAPAPAPNSKSSSSSSGHHPILVHYFPTNSYMSRPCL